MDLSLDESQEILARTFADLLERECPTTHVREHEDTGFSSKLWDRYVELGAAAMGLPEAVGGLELGLLELGLVALESGRALAPIPFAEISSAGRLLASILPDDPLLLEIAEGRSLVSLAPTRPHAIIGTDAAEDSARYVPFGSAVDHVLGRVGDDLVLATRSPDRVSEHVPDVGSGALALWDLDPASGEGARVIASGPEASDAFARAENEWKLLTGFYLVGLARQALDIGTEYARERIQFGVPIGGFQAIAHPLADGATRVDGAELLAFEAAWAANDDPGRFDALCSMAFVWATQTAQFISGVSLHTHGGYGFSTEYDIQLFYRRPIAVTLFAGGPREELLSVAERCCGAVARAPGERGGN